MSSISSLSLRIPVQCPTLIGFDLPLTTLISITEMRKKLLACTQDTTRAKLELLRSARLIHGDQKTTTRHAMALSKAKGTHEPTSTYHILFSKLLAILC
jgi:hypothetical protein